MVNRIRKFDGNAFDPWDIFYDSACNIMLDLVRINISLESIVYASFLKIVQCFKIRIEIP